MMPVEEVQSRITLQLRLQGAGLRTSQHPVAHAIGSGAGRGWLAAPALAPRWRPQLDPDTDAASRRHEPARRPSTGCSAASRAPERRSTSVAVPGYMPKAWPGAAGHWHRREWRCAGACPGQRGGGRLEDRLPRRQLSGAVFRSALRPRLLHLLRLRRLAPGRAYRLADAVTGPSASGRAVRL